MVTKELPKGAQLLTHAVSGRHITPCRNADSDLQVRLWRQEPTTTAKTAMWEILPISSSENKHLVRIKNAGWNRCLTLKNAELREPVTFAERDDDDEGQIWLLVHAGPAQADFVIACPSKPNLVVSPREGLQINATPIEVEEYGPWTDQLWRWRTPRT
ncbi:hypothetical protein [Streptomyces sp. NPDC001480]|uniref:hypothetical protein n=1 Tax=Streptomyces sp. NPDC001480 TaxID=3364577 RepID=UPI003686E291